MPSLLAPAPIPALAAVLLAADDSPLILGTARLHLTFALDLPGALLLGVAALLWIASGAYASQYLQGRPNRGRFVVCWLITLTGCLGVFLAADMVSFYFLLALLTLGACGLVIYHETPRAWRAGAIYIGLALLAEALLLMAFVLLAAQIPGDSLLIRDAAAALPTSPQRDLILALLIAGLGIKAGLVPFHFWMPLAYAAAPTPASAVLSGAVVKASVLGMIRFLAFDTARPDWGTALAAAGLFAALYGVVIGITQRNPKVVLAYSSVSQMGFIVAVIGMGMIAGDDRAALASAFYAAHHVLVKGALFLSVGVIAATGSRRLWPMLLPVAIIAVGLGGLPLTGGALAKIVVDGPLGDGTASKIATLSAVGTTLLMLQFLRSLAKTASRDPEAKAAAGLVWPWLATAAVSLVVPWTLYLAVPSETLPDPLAPAVLWKALWPVLLGAVLAIGLWRWARWLPRVPEGDVVVAIDGGVRLAVAWGKTLERMDNALRQWPAAGVSLLILIVALGAALFAR
ncbi:proton-conducting transporter membrane subunit [Bradyrhizobium sp. URHD0069]|uniref:proton-conducting transporter transmembrane domain-containing protein n=1 Tax=Bradyrhizobium sp. URHD0069 TaxID=1380355 RepID=UPI000691D14E|nr:proton-conducting transporter membrane subunit [Bradyrhizobium sp. URHD0069]